MKWFNSPRTLEELKKQYKKLAVQHHPDLGGNTQEMQEINAEYDVLFEKLKNVRTNAEGKTYTAKEPTTETPDEYKDIIEKLIHLNGIDIEICGSWLWITGDTRPHKEVLKSLHFRWSKSKCAWYYHSEDYRKTSKRSYSLDEIRDLYGSEKVRTEPALRLAIV